MTRIGARRNQLQNRYYDLTITYGGSPWDQPFLFEAPVIKPIHTHDEHGRSNTFFSSACHLGTHIDAPFHFVRDGATIENIPLDQLIGDGIVLDLRADMRAGQQYRADSLNHAAGGRGIRDKIVVLHTGWLEQAYGTGEYYGPRHPYYSDAAVAWLIDLRPKALVVDTGVDPIEPPRPGDNPAHRALLGAGIPLIENVMNISVLPADGFRIFALPLRLFGADGAPARVIAEVPA